jgi:hypothetical protein
MVLAVDSSIGWCEYYEATLPHGVPRRCLCTTSMSMIYCFCLIIQIIIQIIIIITGNNTSQYAITIQVLSPYAQVTIG